MPRYIFALLAVPAAVIFVSGCKSPTYGTPPKPDLLDRERLVRRAPAEQPPKDAALEDYVRIAMENNPGVEAARQSWMAAYRRLDQVTALPDPRLTIGYFLESVETRVGPQDWTVATYRLHAVD